jgi:5-methylcytosine-specific restriction endonuclease McrA
VRRFLIWLGLARYRNYAEYLRSARWKKLRRKCLARDHWRCRVCDSHFNLQVHHRRYAKAWGSETVDDLTTLCERHHDLFEQDRRRTDWCRDERQRSNRDL